MTSPPASILIRPETPDDVPLVLAFIHELAEYERRGHEVVATEAALREALHGAHPAAEVLLAFDGDEPAGFALFFPNFSTFLGQPGIYLEDIYVRPNFRGRGIGRQLLARVAQLAVERGCGRLEWSVLDWNEPAIRFYQSLGAQPLDEWTTYRLTADALARLAERG